MEQSQQSSDALNSERIQKKDGRIYWQYRWFRGSRGSRKWGEKVEQRS